MQDRRIEYYGTLGPSCVNKDTLVEMFEKGMTGIRLNLSHKSLAESSTWIETYKTAAKEAGRENANLLIDLIGPEIRIGDLRETMILEPENRVFLMVDDGSSKAESAIPVPAFVEEYLVPSQRLLLDDGKIELEVLKGAFGALEVLEGAYCEAEPDEIESDELERLRRKNGVLCKVLRGGKLSSRKSLALPGCTIKNPPLTEQDHENLKNAAAYGVTAVMQPFVRGKEDLIALKEALESYGAGHIRIFAKIENMEGVEKLEEMMPYCDTIVIARGDLGNAMPLSHLPVVQNRISEICKKNGKPFMVVTQMLNSMMDSAVPTRAEVNDIFHAVKDGASSVMLTGETAAGKYPVEAMKVLVNTGEETLNYLCQ